MAVRRFDRYWVALCAASLAAIVGYASALAPLVALAVFGAVVLLIVVIAQPGAVLLLLLAALPWEGMLGYPTETLSVVKLLGALLIVSYLITALYAGRSLRAPPTTIAVAALLLLVGLSLLASPDPDAGLEAILRLVLFASFFFLIVQLVDDQARLRRVLGVLTVSTAAASTFALVGFLSGGLERAGGPIEEPNDFAFLIVTVLPVAIYLLLEDPDRRWLWALCVPILTATMLATLSRGAILALVVLALWLILARRIRLGGLVVATSSLIALLGVAILFWASTIGERIEQKGWVADENVAGREALWDGAARMAMDHPLLGVGPGRFGAESVDYVRGNQLAIRYPVAHNTYLEVLAESGVLALCAFLALLAGSWALLASRARAAMTLADRRSLRLVTAIQASLLGAATAAFFLQGQYHPPLWLVAGLAVVVAGVGGRGPEADR